MNGTFQLLRRARNEGISLRPPQTCEVGGYVTNVRPAPLSPAQIPAIEEPLHTGSIYRDLMEKHDRINPRHLK
jgi:hypothetical protein